MAQKLRDQYGYDYKNLKVLLGGWRAWQQKNAVDATGYPIESGTGGDTSAPAVGVTVIVPTTVISPTQAP